VVGVCGEQAQEQQSKQSKQPEQPQRLKLLLDLKALLLAEMVRDTGRRMNG
jgi:purine-binding chemotaxis protein CheW